MIRNNPPFVVALLGVVALSAVWFSGSLAVFLLMLGVLAVAAIVWALPRTAPKPVAGPDSALSAGLPDLMRAVLEGISDPIIVLDHAGRVMLANFASDAVLGQGVDVRSEGKHLSALLRTPELLEAVARVRASGTQEQVEFSFHVPVKRHFEAAITTLPGERGRFVLVHLRDLTRMRRAEEMRADFIANASHELRTPLAAVSGFIETLRGHARNDTEARERFLEIMSVETGRMRRLIDDLLSLTGIELNEHNPPDHAVDLVGVVRDAAAVLAPLAEADGITIAIEDFGALPVLADRDEIFQVFQNLLHNSIKYGRDKGTVRVGFGITDLGGARAGAQAYAAIADEGAGIPREAIPRLTERFYRVDIKRSRERGGTGLGLAIVKHILNRHRGRLQVESTLGQGSVFTVFLPLAAKSQVE